MPHFSPLLKLLIKVALMPLLHSATEWALRTFTGTDQFHGTEEDRTIFGRAWVVMLIVAAIFNSVKLFLELE
ncbi:hypothetical protein Vi05172_g6424 [Venturia inaequalis]|nr:hypothetical protein Vi05172_g6424 [Venturia inaequalis]